MTLERQTIHVSDDTGRIAMLEKRTIGTDDSLPTYSNHLQSASLELDGIGDIISYEEYHPYGTTAFQAKNASINAVAKRYRYTGKERDEESGLYYHGARYYIPWLCRWTAIDPMESKYAGMSPYNYSFNNPVMWNDLSGADPKEPDDPPTSEYNGKPIIRVKSGTTTDLYGYNPDTKKNDILLSTELSGVKVLPEKDSFWGGLWNNIKEAGVQIVTFGAGVANAWSSNNLLGTGRVDPRTAPKDMYHATVAGQLVGDLLSMVTGGIELVVQ